MGAVAKAVEGKVARLVAPGRTVVDTSGKSIGPGHKAWVLDSDVERLTRLGFLVDPTAGVVQRRGPATLSEKG
ncbi:hypothetical protein IAI52_27660 [Pseudomonas lurida]|uniref:hypothetical protein n=1 Tax=Pseudomonas lurida TaxID=244566 RepID=UPI0016569978|nr:hypothetical protein [Pseudomonas lurida]MBC8984027.1 hypothetical protein [Pseudomonas lurida]